MFSISYDYELSCSRYLLYTNHVIDLFNIGRFKRNIPINIEWIELCPFFFYPAVFQNGFRVSAQIVPESKMFVQFFGILRAHIEMMFLQMVLAIIRKRFPPEYA